MWRRAAWAVLFLCLMGNGAAAKSTYSEAATLWCEPEAKIASFATDNPEIIFVIDEAINIVFDVTAVDRIDCSLRHNMWRIIGVKSLIDVFFIPARWNLGRSQLNNWSVFQRVHKLSFYIDADVVNLGGALSTIFDVVGHCCLFIGDETVWKTEMTHNQGRSLALDKSVGLQEQNGGGNQPNYYHPPGPPAYDSRPPRNFVLGIISVAFGIGVAWYAGGYERGDEYKTGQYITESLICFGLGLLAFALVSQGAILILFGVWII